MVEFVAPLNSKKKLLVLLIRPLRKLSAAVGSRAPENKSAALQEFLIKHLPSISDVIPEDKHNDRSLRDRLAHWESVSAGSFSISRAPWGYDVALIGGGHDLPVFRPMPAKADNSPGGGMVTYTALGPLLRNQFERVERIIRLFTAFSMRSIFASRGSLSYLILSSQHDVGSLTFVASRLTKRWSRQRET